MFVEGCSYHTRIMYPTYYYYFFKFHFIYFIYGCVGSSLLCEGFLQLWQAGATLHRSARASHYRGLSCCGAQAPDAHVQQLWLTGPLLCGTWDLPRPGLEPVSPALAGRFSTTAPPGKPHIIYFNSFLQACGLSSCGLPALECRFCSCGARAQLLCGTWDLPRPGLEPVSPALAGRFSTTAPPGKPYPNYF